MSTIYETITATIVAELEKGAAPWVKPWHADSSADKNILSQKPYQGINRLILGMSGMAKGFSNPAWGSYKQWGSLGANVRKGEKGTQIVFYSPGERENADGTKETYAILKSYWVFNVQQVDGIEITSTPKEDKPFNQHDAAEQRIIKTGAAITHGGDAAFYMPSQDRIQLPNKSAFNAECHYYATAMHELVHWSGAKHRLDRELKGRYASPDYAFEELVAELGAAFLCQDLGIHGELRHAGYIGSWLKACRDDSRAIFKAAALAQKAADFIVNLDATAQAIAA